MSKTPWERYLENIRKKELDLAFKNYAKGTFKNGLELGAGNGFQSILLSKYVDLLVCTEYNSDRLVERNIPNVDYKICDAEIIQTYFQPNSFDLVFSSNMFEHLPNPEKSLAGIHEILKPDGIVILLMPSVFWKFCHIGLFYPTKFFGFVAKLLRGKVKYISPPTDTLLTPNKGNNLKINERSRSRLIKFLRWPEPHGVSESNFKEFFNFRKIYWRKLFEKEKFECFMIKKGPVTSGYGLGWNKIRHILESLGFASEYIYFLRPIK